MMSSEKAISKDILQTTWLLGIFVNGSAETYHVTNITATLLCVGKSS